VLQLQDFYLNHKRSCNEKRIFTIRGEQVMLDRDLAEMYQVESKRLNEQVKRNSERFSELFCFQLNKSESDNWKSQTMISNSDKLGLKIAAYAFTEQGVAILSSVCFSLIFTHCCSSVSSDPSSYCCIGYI
jgi:thiol:disulfide interchange protein